MKEFRGVDEREGNSSVKMFIEEFLAKGDYYSLYLIERLLGPEAEPEPRYAAGQDHGGQET